MLVVADSSPLIGLANIGQTEILPQMFGKVTIPTQVAAELSDVRRTSEVRAWIGSRPAWLLIRSPARLEEIPGLHLGERAAISLVREVKADLLLIDEMKGRDAARVRSIRTIRTGALLLEAANRGIVADFRDAVEALRRTDFRIPDEVLDQLIAKHERWKRGT